MVPHDPDRSRPNISLNQVLRNNNSGRRSRLHLNLYTNDREAEEERLVEIRATRYPRRYRQGTDLVVLEDPNQIGLQGEY
jgi:Glyoxalase-like domain